MINLSTKLDLLTEAELIPEKVLEEAEITLDKRLGITRSLYDYKKGLKYIEEVRDEAVEAGLDDQLALIIRSALNGKKISAENPPTFSEMYSIISAIQKSGILTDIKQKQQKLKKRFKRSEMPDKIKEAVKYLRKDVQTSSGRIKIKDLINPYGLNMQEPLKIIHRTNKRGILLSNEEPLLQQYEKIVALLRKLNYGHLVKKLIKRWETSTIVLKYFLPDTDEQQINRTAAIYALRSIAKEFVDEEDTKERQEKIKERDQ